ncbi:capsular polysaccharide biosynthesis protein [Alphaproteobacteria bacterium GH1-50]|uniref:Capsular polysaccharide biosynthesis protein n=1 Tax=Kangsaoukella pontilimi TaxID=2691042 RepID=A0A7C9NE67_9RHOB|nr:capsular polysaccharide biosynthesis protein [Kangsaoukella pontilimi]MXQ07979.1 capsular polysaccharide biosynthesis protein [Kangsaoukella pontilimi]
MTDGTAAATRLCVYNGGLLLKPGLKRILSLAGWDVTTGLPGEGDWVGLWGRSPTAWRGEKVAGWTEAPVLTVEDAFLRSVHPARLRDSLPLGLCLDRTGVHFDASVPSDLETLLATHPLDDTHLLNRARDAAARMRHAHLGKYAATDPDLAPPDPGYAVVIDQTEGDAALMGATRDDFRQMLTTAAAENPASRILVKQHPETAGGARKGMLDDLRGVDRAEPYSDPISPWVLFEGAVAVYTHSSTLGFEAIYAGHKPRVFGQPFYAGWGLTQDEDLIPRRDRTLSRAQLFAAAMILYPVWYDPLADRLCEVEDALSILDAQTRQWREDRAGYVAAGIRRWKRPHLQHAFGQEKRLKFASSPDKAKTLAQKDGRSAVVWGGAEAPDGTIRMEDGFLRSRGLGARLTPPASLVLDDSGIYFDPTRESRLDRLIAASGDLPEGELRRAEALARRIAKAGVTKYGQSDVPPSLDDPRRKILVAGQVEDDASILMGAGEIRRNIYLLRETRQANPDALIIWKPHPDVEAGLRKGRVEESDLEGLADVALTGAGAAAAIDVADEVWTITSTLGFEALLRGKPVTTLGMPFYAGWGLTDDRMPAPAHRGKDVTRAGLIHACLIGYPRYFHPATGAPLSPEQTVALLASDEADLPGETLLGRLQRFFRRV